jgi:capsular polysaccharide biosynthesis protein
VDETEAASAGLPDYRGFWRRRRWWVLTTLTITVLAGVLFVATTTPVYESSTQIEFEPPANRTELERLIFGSTDLGTQLAALESPAVLEAIVAHQPPSGRPATVSDLRNSFEAEIVPGTTIFELTVKDETPARAAQLAEILADGYLQYLRRDANTRVERALRRIMAEQAAKRQELESLQAQLAAGTGATRESLELERDETFADLRFLSTRVSELRSTVELVRLGSVIQPAEINEDPARPQPVRDIALAAVLGLLLGTALGLAREWVDPRVTDPGLRALERDGVPVLGRVPSARAESAQQHRPPHVRQAYGRVRARLEARASSPDRTLALVPASPSIDARAIAAHLAAEFADAGLSVLIVDATAPLREGRDPDAAGRPMATSGPAEPGLELVGPGVHLVELSRSSVQGGDGGPGGGRLSAARLQGLAGAHDVVLVASACADLDAGAFDAARAAQQVVVVVDERHTRMPNLLQVLSDLAGIGGEVAGIVLAEDPRGRAALTPARPKDKPHVQADEQSSPDAMAGPGRVDHSLR